MHEIWKLVATALGLAAALAANPAAAQSASASIPANCTQNGTTVTCTTTTTFTIPTTVNLVSQTSGSGFSYTTGTSNIVCSGLSASPSSVSAVSSNVLLTANCTGSYAYFWNQSTVPTSSATTNVTTPSSTASYPVSYRVDVCPAGSTTTSASCVTYTTQVSYSASVAAPSGCSITPASPTLAAGISQQFAVSCTGGGPIATYSWTKNSTPFGSASTITDTPFPVGGNTANVVYAVTVGNTGGSVTVSTTATLQSTVTNYCTRAYPDVIVPDSSVAGYYDIPMIGADTYTIKLTISDSQNTTGAAVLPSFGIIESPSANIAFKHATISKNPCDFTGTAQTIMYWEQTGGRLVTLNDPNRVGSGFARLTTGVWYVNIKNLDCQGLCYTRFYIPTPGLR